MNNKILPNSNHSPCECKSTSADRINGIPDKVQRPARKEHDVNSISSKMNISNKGYKIVEVRVGANPVGMGESVKKKKKGMKYREADDGDGDAS